LLHILCAFVLHFHRKAMAPLGFLGRPLLLLTHASAAKSIIHGSFLNRKALPVEKPLEHTNLVHRSADPKWNGTSVQEEPKYHNDYPKDENNVSPSSHTVSHAGGQGSHADGHGADGGGHSSHADGHSSAGSHQSSHGGRPVASSGGVSVPDFSPVAGHSAEWYENKCTKIKERCEERKEAIDRAHQDKLHHLEDEYKSESKRLDNVEEASEAQKKVVDEQRGDVKDAKEKVKDAEKVYERTKDCPAELRRLEDELEELESHPNDSDDAIDEECQKRKEILRKQRCVKRFGEAESTLGRRDSAFDDEKDTLAHNKAASDRVDKALKPREESTDEAKRALDKARKQGGRGYSAVDEECEREMDSLRDLADKEVDAAEAEYRRHKKMWEARKEQHEKLEDDVAEQKDEVEDEKRRVANARDTHDQLKECPAELERAERQLRELEETPNESDEDIDAECEQRKVVMRKRRCVEKFEEARDVLTHRKGVYSSEEHELGHDKRDEQNAEKVADGYEKSVRRFEDAWNDAKAARRALEECAAESSSSSSAGGGYVGGGGGGGGSGGEGGAKGAAGMLRPTLVALALGPLLALAMHGA